MQPSVVLLFLWHSKISKSLRHRPVFGGTKKSPGYEPGLAFCAKAFQNLFTISVFCCKRRLRPWYFAVFGL